MRKDARRYGRTGEPAAETHRRIDTAASPAVGDGRHDEGLRLNDTASVLALQRAVGNHAVSEFLTAQRMMPSPAGQGQATGQGQNQAAAVTPSEVEELRAYLTSTTNPDIRTLLNELIPLLQQVATWTPTPGTGGGNTRNHGPAHPGGPNQYEIQYASGGTASERIAVLVHELTHVVVNESYSSDMLNYPVAPLPTGSTATTEAGRQQDRINATDQDQLNAFRAHGTRNAADLLELLPSAGFSPARMREAADKLSSHTAQKPLYEYDAVLSHLLVWADRDRVPRTSTFYQRLTQMVAEAAGWRQAGMITPTATADSLNSEVDRVMAARAGIPAPAPAPAAAPPAATTPGTADNRGMRDVLSRLAGRFSRRDQS